VARRWSRTGEGGAQHRLNRDVEQRKGGRKAAITVPDLSFFRFFSSSFSFSRDLPLLRWPARWGGSCSMGQNKQMWCASVRGLRFLPFLRRLGASHALPLDVLPSSLQSTVDRKRGQETAKAKRKDARSVVFSLKTNVPFLGSCAVLPSSRSLLRSDDSPPPLDGQERLSGDARPIRLLVPADSSFSTRPPSAAKPSR
jgi:hypothetical protein